MGGRGDRGRGPDPGALPDPGPPAPVQRAAEGRQELPVAGGLGGGGVAPPDGLPWAQAKGSPLLRPLRPRGGAARDPRPPPAELPGPHLLGGQVQAARPAGPALPPLRHRAVLGPVRGCGRPRPLRGDGRGPHAVPLGGHRGGGGAPRVRDGRGGRGAPVRTGRPAAGPAGGRAQGGPITADGLRAARGPRRGRHGRGRAGGRGPGLPRPQGAGGRAEQLDRRQGRGPDADPNGRPGGRTALRRSRGRGAPPGARPGRAGVGRGARGLALVASGRAGDADGAPARRQARPAGDGGPQRRGGPGSAPPAPGLGPQQPLAGAHRAAGRPRPSPGPPADRVLRHEPPPGHRLRGLDGGLRGRPCQEGRLPQVQGGDRRGQRRLRGHGGGAPPQAHGAHRRAPERGTRPAGAGSPTRPSSSSSTAARGSSGWGSGWWPSWASKT